MAIRKPRPRFDPILKPGPSGGPAPKKLMDNQDTKRKGDSYGRERVQLTFWVTPEKKDEIKAFAAARDMTVSRLIVESIDERMSREV